MLTQRGWWLFITLCAMLGIGTWGPFPLVAQISLVIFAWFCWEWFRFGVSVRFAAPGLRLEREVRDLRGPVSTLWAGRSFEVRVTVHADRGPKLAYVLAEDAVPFGIDYLGGVYSADGEMYPGKVLSFRYDVRCGTAGLARFEGVRVRLADLQGLFYHATFLRTPVVLRVLPVLAHPRAAMASTKRINELPPPGLHRLRRPGSGSELLDLRDYFPGDPPKTIAWKVSARRDRLITKEFESEVPIRCTLFVDTSDSVRVPSLCPPATGGDGTWRSLRAIDRLVEIAAGVAQANVATRDLTVLCLFDNEGSTVLKPDRTGPHLTQMLHRLADAAALDPTTARVDPEPLLPLAYSFADIVYPEQLKRSLNKVPWWSNWFGYFPARTRQQRGFLRRLYRWRFLLYLTGVLGIPLLCALLYISAVITVLLARMPQDVIAKTIARGLAITAAVSLLAAVSAITFLATCTLFGERMRQTQAWRKRLAMFLAHRYGLVAGGASALLEDDDQLSLQIQRFLSEHRVPYSLPLYGPDGRYLFASPGKISALATALLRAVGRGRDNELFVLIADVVELDDELEPLLRAVKVALGRHHQVLLVCPWPPAIELPEGEASADTATWVQPVTPGAKPLPRGMAPLTTLRFHAAYRRLRFTFGRIGVQIVCAATDRPIALILDRIERLRRMRRVH